MQFPQPTDFNGWVFSLTSFPEIWFKACALSMYRYVWYLEIRDEFCECFFPQDFHANKNCSLQKTSTFVRILVQASQFDNYWWVMHLDSQKTFEAETTTKNPQQKVSDIRILYRYFVCFSESVRFSVFFFFRFQLETKWTYVDSSIFSFSTSQAQKWTVRWFVCVCVGIFHSPRFFFETKKHRPTYDSPQRRSHPVWQREQQVRMRSPVSSPEELDFLKKKMIFSVCLRLNKGELI